jgi:hypothetical protein
MPVKVPICTFDAKTGILCGNCEAKLRSGKITQADVEASKAVVALADKIPEVSRFTLHRAWSVGGDYVLELDARNLQTVRSEPEILAGLASTLGGRAWTVAAGTGDRKFLDDLFFPIRILTVNTVWMADGSRVSKVIVTGKRGEGFLSNLQRLRNVVKHVKGIELIIETEREAMVRT